MITSKYKTLCTTSSDINEHLPTLKEYALKVNHITECGVRGVVSSYAFASGLLGKSDNNLVQVDLDTNDNVINFQKECKLEGVNVVFYQQSDLECPDNCYKTFYFSGVFRAFFLGNNKFS